MTEEEEEEEEASFAYAAAHLHTPRETPAVSQLEMASYRLPDSLKIRSKLLKTNVNERRLICIRPICIAGEKNQAPWLIDHLHLIIDYSRWKWSRFFRFDFTGILGSLTDWWILFAGNAAAAHLHNCIELTRLIRMTRYAASVAAILTACIVHATRSSPVKGKLICILHHPSPLIHST